MIIEVMCRIADGPLKPGELEVTQTAVPLVSWSVSTRNVSGERDLQGKDLAVELHFPDNTVWTGEVYPVAAIEPDQVPGPPPEHESPLTMQLRGIGALSENSIPVHSDVVVQRIDAMLAERQS
ncbi:MAG: hypothetical protein ACRDRR_22225 [Pseudonocardiaceae bacterium]